MSLVPRQSLTAILEAVSAKQRHARDRLPLAIPMDEILSYYEAQLLTDVVTIKEGLLMKIAILLTTRQTSFTVFLAIPVPKPQHEKSRAIKWRTEAPYLAISKDNMETAVLTENDMKHCLGSSRYQIFHEIIATETGHGSCLATLFFKGNQDALKVCAAEQLQLLKRQKTLAPEYVS